MIAQQPERTLFARYRATDDAAARARLIERHLPLAHGLARRYARSQDSAEDLVQVASLALVKAVDRYDPERGRSFSSFAVPTILGELKRHFRDTRWALHMPRDLQERALTVERELERLTPKLRRAPTPGELAAALGLTVEEVLEAREAHTAIDAASLDAPVAGDDDGGDNAGDLVGAPDEGYELAEDVAAIESGLVELPERDRLALWLRFHEDLTQAEIGEHLGVSQMQVSRILRRALAQLRTLASAA